MAVTQYENQPSTTVSSGGTDAPSSGSSETWTVASSAAFPAASSGASPPTLFHVADTASGYTSELIAVTNISGSTWTVTRGAESTATVAHVAGFTITQVVSAGDLTALAVTGGDLTAETGGYTEVTATHLGTPLPVSQGGIGQASLTSYGLLAGGTASTAAVQQAGAGTAGQALVSGGSGALPSFATLGITGGGTGGTTSTAAFAAISPLTTAGDLVYEASAGTAARLAIGSAGQVLAVSSGTLPAWTPVGSLSAAGTVSAGVVQLASAAALNTGTAAAGTTGKASDSGHVHFSSGMFACAPKAYGPSTPGTFTTTSNTFAALSSGTVCTNSFTAPASGTVIVRAALGPQECTNAGDFCAYALCQTGDAPAVTGVPIQTKYGAASGVFPPTVLEFLVTGLSGTNQFDLMFAVGGGATLSLFYGSDSSLGSGNLGAQIIMSVIAV